MPACLSDILKRIPCAGTRKEEVGELLTPLLTDNDVSMEVAGFAALSLGLVFVGDCHAASAEAMLQVGARINMHEHSRSLPALVWSASTCPGRAATREVLMAELVMVNAFGFT